MRRRGTITAITAILLLLFGCATSYNEDLEDARFALDNGTWDNAISHASAALEAHPDSIEAALILSAAYAGRGGFRLIPLAQVIADRVHRRDLFDVVHDEIARNFYERADIRSAILVLTEQLLPAPHNEHALFTDHQFQLGMLLAIEAFASALAVQPALGGNIDPTTIDAAIEAIVEENLLRADDALINAGLDEEDELVRNIRQTYCVLKNHSIREESGFDQSILQDMVHCQLAEDDGAELSADAGDFQSPHITTCADFDYDSCDEAASTEP